jgi:hypothetical protein
MAQPLPPPRFLMFAVTFLLCLPAVAASADLRINPEAPSAKSPWLRGEQVIVLPDMDSECNQRQWDKCGSACGAVKKLSLTCDVQFDWQPDGSCIRTVICTCVSPSSPQLVSMPTKAAVATVSLPDSCHLEPTCIAVDGIEDGPDGVDPLGVVVDDGVPF